VNQLLKSPALYIDAKPMIVSIYSAGEHAGSPLPPIYIAVIVNIVYIAHTLVASMQYNDRRW
jgi:hypothetical protein